MVEMEFNCIHCGQSISVEEELAGRVGVCPACGREIVVPRRQNKGLGIRRQHAASSDGDGAIDVGGADEAPRMSEYQRLQQEAAECARRARVMKFAQMAVGLVVLIAASCFAWFYFAGFSKEEGIDNQRPVQATPQKDMKKAVKPEPVKPGPDTSKACDLDSCKDKLAVIGDEGKGGSGFIVQMDGRKYFVTNEHITRGPEKWFEKILLINGQEIRLGRFDIARDRDLARFEVDEQVAAFNQSKVPPKMDLPITVFGNESGLGMARSSRGRIVAIGPSRFEIDAHMVVGYSGSPVLDGDGQVVGVFTKMWGEEESRRWDIGDRELGSTKGWALGFSSVKWEPVEWNEYRKQIGIVADVVTFIGAILPFMELEDEKRSLSGELPHYGEENKPIFSVCTNPFWDRLLQLSKIGEALLEVRKEFGQAQNGGHVEHVSRRILNLEKTGDTSLEVREESRSGFSLVQDEGYKSSYARRLSRRKLKIERRLVETVRDAFVDVKKILAGTRWVTQQFKAGMTTVHPMQWYQKSLASHSREANLDDAA